MKAVIAMLLLLASTGANAASGFTMEPNPHDFGVITDPAREMETAFDLAFVRQH